MRTIDVTGAAAPFAAHVAAAGQLMSAGRFDEADILVAEVLAAAPEQVDALLLRATGALARGALEPAFDLLAALAARYPGRADVIANLGAAHAALGRPEEAFICLEQAVLLAPDDGFRRAELAALLLTRDDTARARTEILTVQRLAQAAEDAALAAEGWSLAARLLLLEGRPGMAEAAFRRALALRPGHAPDLALLADLLMVLERPEEALAAADAAYLAAPADPARALTRACRLMDVGRLGEAEAAIRRMLAISPHDLPANDALARLLILKGEAAAGIAGFAQVVRRAEGDPAALFAMARLLRLSGDLETALAFADQASQRAPDDRAVHQLQSHLRLALGRIAQVWPDPQEQVAPLPEVPALFIPEGLPAGEVVLLARFAGGLRPQGGRVACHCERALLPVLEGIVGIAAIDAPAPVDAIALPALPSLRGVGAQDLAHAPYLAVEAGRRARWGAAMAHLPRPWIGLAYDGSPLGLPLEALATALAGQGTWVSLAFGRERSQLSACPHVVDAGAEMADARDLAAILSHLDLVAGSAGLAMHMAGAMGVSGMALVPASQPWAFAHRDGAALWYPSIRVAPQARAGDWTAPLRALAARAADLSVSVKDATL